MGDICLDDDDDGDNRRIISNYVMAVDVESSIKFDALLQVTGYILQCFTSRFLLIPRKNFSNFSTFSPDLFASAFFIEFIFVFLSLSFQHCTDYKF